MVFLDNPFLFCFAMNPWMGCKELATYSVL